GQTPVFYSFFTSAATLLVISVMQPGSGAMAPRVTAARLIGASLVFGLALQVKYICALEAAAVSLVGLAYVWRTRVLPRAAIPPLAIAMMIGGVAPTAMSALAFWLTDHWHAFLYANFISIFQKHIWRLTTGTYAWRLFTATLFAVAYLPLSAFA